MSKASDLPYDPKLRAEYIKHTKPKVGARVLYVTPVLSIRAAIVVEPTDDLVVSLTVFTAGNKDDDWLEMSEGSKRDIRTQARLVVRRGTVNYDKWGQEPNTWHWPNDPEMAQATARFISDNALETGNPGSR